MKFSLIILLLAVACIAHAQPNNLGVFQSNADIGHPKHKGAASYDAATQTYTLRGSGYNIWFNRDEFHYLYNKIGGDFILTADFAFTGVGKDPHRKIGWMVRESADEAAASANAVLHGDGLMVLQWRPLRGAYMRDPEDEIFFPKKALFQVMQLERNGKKLIMRVANAGEPLQEVGAHEMPDLRDSVLAGVFISSHDSNQVEEARIWNVRIDKPVANNWSPNPQIQKTMSAAQTVIGSRLEMINIADGKRMVVRDAPVRLESPIWMPDGKTLLYNEGGALYKIGLKGGTPEKLHTDTVARITDYGISFDGKRLAISSDRLGVPGGSAVYVVPLGGGTPKQITKQTLSYGHGWAPNNREIIIVAQQAGNPVYNLYKVDVQIGKETPLTSNTTGHVDGPEYSPDGKRIYYNANPTGTMQLWRMKPDGSGSEQLTFDEYHNWFPHLSPDGKWIAFISFPTDIDPASPAWYKRVMVRLMPASGGAPRVLAYLYGGQGTLNVNSWSPDSRQLSFVSNSEPVKPK